MMKREFRDAWVAKLRSGEVNQARSFLCSKDGRCCLGVAYMIDDAGAEIRKGHYTTYFDGNEGMPHPRHLVSWGISYDDAFELAVMNDKGKTFNEIADHIMKFPVKD